MRRSASLQSELVDGFNWPDFVVEPVVERQNQDHEKEQIGSDRPPETVGKEERDDGGHACGDDRGRNEQQDGGHCRDDLEFPSAAGTDVGFRG